MMHITDPLGTYSVEDFYKEPAAKVSFDEVKQAGSCMLTESGDIVVPAQAPTYVKPKVRERMEKEKGPKRPPLTDDKYKDYVTYRSTLPAMAKAVSALSLDSDFVSDRSALTVLLDYLNGELTPNLKQKGQFMNPLDLVKVSKTIGGKGLTLERIFESKNLWAELRPYRGEWRRSEVSEHGTYFPAWERMAMGEINTKTLSVTGLKQVAGTSRGKTSNCFRFVEFSLGGFSFGVRVPTHAVADGDKNVELQHKNFYFQREITCLKTYYKMMLGGVDQLTLGIQRSGKVVQVNEYTINDVIEREPAVVDAAEKRLGYLVGLLKKVQSTCTGEGPWVLQWQKGSLVLGEYKEPSVEGMVEAAEGVEMSV
jgi:hypothetical protein